MKHESDMIAIETAQETMEEMLDELSGAHFDLIHDHEEDASSQISKARGKLNELIEHLDKNLPAFTPWVNKE